MLKRLQALFYIILFCSNCLAQDSFEVVLDQFQNCMEHEKTELLDSLRTKLSDGLLTASYAEIARFNKIVGDYSYRHDLFDTAIGRYKDASENYLLSGIIDSSFMDTQINLVESYLNVNNEEDAEKTIRKAIIYCSDILDDCPLSADLFRACLKIGKYLNDPVASEQIHQKIQKYAFNYYHKLHPEEVPERPIEEMHESDNCYRILNELDTNDYIIHLGLKGCLLLEANVLDEAMVEFEKALNVANRIGKLDTKLTGVIWIRLLDVYGKLGEIEKVKSFVPKVIDYYASINDNRYTPYQVNYAAGHALIEGGKYENGLAYLKQAEILLNSCGGNDDNYLLKAKQNLYSNFLYAYVQLEDDRNAYKILEKLMDLFNNDSETYYSCLYQLALYDNQFGNYEKSIMNLKKMDKLAGTLYGINFEDQESICWYMGNNYMGLKKFKKAQTYYLKSISIFQQNSPNDYEGLMTHYNNLANAYFLAGNYACALDNFVLSGEYCRKLYGTVSPNIKEAINKCNNHLK